MIKKKSQNLNYLAKIKSKKVKKKSEKMYKVKKVKKRIKDWEIENLDGQMHLFEYLAFTYTHIYENGIFKVILFLSYFKLIVMLCFHV